MEHGITWLSYLPGFASCQRWVGAHTHGLLGGAAGIQHVAAALLVTAIILAMALAARASLRQAGGNAVVPDAHISARNLLELGAEMLLGQMRETIGPGYRRYFPVLCTFTLFILMSNLLGLVPGMIPPTDNWNTTLAAGLFIFVYYNFHGIRVHGLGHLTHLANPVGARWGWLLSPLFLPIEIFGQLARPISMAIRLAANMMGDHAVLMAFLSLAPLLVPLPLMLLGLIVALVQTLIFVLLSIIYLSIATAGHGEAEEH